MQDFLMTTMIGAVATAIAAHLSDDELALAAAVLTQLGDTLETIAVLRDQRNAAAETEIV